MVAPRAKPKAKLFHAVVQVTRIEEWRVEAANAEEARQLLANGGGERCHLGECLHLEVERIRDA